MARKVRRDSKGRPLRKGETYRKDKDLYCYSYTNILGDRKCFYSRSLAELRAREDRMEKDRLDGLDIYLMQKATINFVFDRYMQLKRNLRQSTYTNYVYMYDRFVREGFGKQLIADIKYTDVVRFYHSLIDGGMKVNTLDTIHTLLHPTFQLAVRDDIIRTNPSDGAMTELKRSMKKYSGVKHALTLEEQRAFLDFLDTTEENQRWKPLFTVLFGTGCRIGEIIGLRWQDIDLDAGQININHAVTYYPRVEDSYRCEFHVSLPKTDSGIRIVPMIGKVKDAFIQEREYQERCGNFCMAEIDGMSDFIFSNRFGNLHNPQSINRVIKRIVEDHNNIEIIAAKKEKRPPLIIPKFSCHITRHTFCTRLCENDVNVKVIQTIMGHKEIQTTLDIYAEITGDNTKKVIFNLEDKDVL